MTERLGVLPEKQRLKTTTSRCPVCLDAIPAEVLEQDGRVVMVKSCHAHGRFEVVLTHDRRTYYDARGAPSNAEDCGRSCGCAPASATDEAQDPYEILSTCVGLIEIVESCNLACPTCYAASPVGTGDEVQCIRFDEFVARVQGVVDRKGFMDILQLSGGEPTIHPEFFRVLEWSLAHEQIGYVLINTNLVRIASDDDFRQRLGDLRRSHGGFELYAQFDGPQQAGQVALRGADLRAVRRQAIDAAGALGVPSTLVMVVTPETIGSLGDTFRFGLERLHCRGVCFQPVFGSGRVGGIESSTLPIASSPPRPISVGDVITHLVDQSEGILTEADFTPLPCGDPNCHTIGYLLRTKGEVIGLSRLIDLPSMQGFLGQRLNYNLHDLARCGCEVEPLGAMLKELEIGPDQPYRMLIKPFMDAWTFDQDRIDRCCTHVIRPDGRLDSFCQHYLTTVAGAEAG